jgi:predicted transcriptional regulator
MPKSIVEMASEIVAAQAGYAPMAAEEISTGVKKIVEVLQELHVLESSAAANGDAAGGTKLNPQDSIQRNCVICLECHKEFKLLSNRHLSQHGLTSREYKLKYGLPLRQALSAKVLTQTRRKIAKEKGLGAKLVAHRRQQK